MIQMTRRLRRKETTETVNLVSAVHHLIRLLTVGTVTVPAVKRSQVTVSHNHSAAPCVVHFTGNRSILTLLELMCFHLLSPGRKESDYRSFLAKQEAERKKVILEMASRMTEPAGLRNYIVCRAVILVTAGHLMSPHEWEREIIARHMTVGDVAAMTEIMRDRHCPMSAAAA